MRWVDVCELEDILPDTGVGALVGGRQLALFRLADDRVFALDNRDPHSGANVLARGLVGDLGGELVVASPLYKQHHRLRDGHCLENSAHSVRSYPARVAGGRVEVSLDPAVSEAA